MSTSLRDFLQHIHEECDYIIRVTAGKSKDDLLEDETLKRALTRSIEIIGEAVKKLDDDFKSTYPEVEWRKIARARDRITHHYFGIDYDIIWSIVTDRIVPLRDYIAEIIEKLGTK